MSKFYIKTDDMAKSCKRLSGVESSVKNAKQVVGSVNSSLDGIGLSVMKGPLNAIESKLGDNVSKVNSLSSSLNQIIIKYKLTEAGILGGNSSATFNDPFKSIDLSYRAGQPDLLQPISIEIQNQYGLSDTTLRYLQDYYPELLDELLNSSNPDDVLKRVNGILENNHIIMMENYGYSYEAIRYLLDNNPGMISSLYATSHWSTADVDDVRMAIYQYCHENNICIYDPNYDFAAYNADSNNYYGCQYAVQPHTNCYAYAFGITHDPRTGELLPLGGLQPGYFGGKEDEFYDDLDIIFSPEDNGATLVEYIKEDAAALDLNFVPYEEGMTGGQMVALVIDTNGQDYHWYYYEDESGTWYNKQGPSPATDRYLTEDFAYYDSSRNYSDDTSMFYSYTYDENGQVIAVELTGQLPDETIGDDYLKHAEANGYQDVGVFYVTREDVGVFY